MRTIIAILSGALSAYLLFSVFFKSKEDFIDCVRFWFTPDIISLFRGQYDEDFWAEFKLFLWLIMSVGIGYGVYSLQQ